MNISKKSWHYKLNNIFRDGLTYQHISLCNYFWSTVFLTSLMSFALLLALIVILSPIFVLTGLFRLFTISIFWLEILDFGLHMFLIFSVAALIVTTIVFWEEINAWIVREFHLEQTPRTEPAKPPGIFISYLKAKKDKVCPLIEFKD